MNFSLQSNVIGAARLSFSLSRPLAPTQRVTVMRPTCRFRLDREGYSRCWQLLSAAGIDFVEKDRSISHLGPNRIEETTIHGMLHAAHGSVSCRLITFGRHYKLDLVAERNHRLVGDVIKALSAYLL